MIYIKGICPGNRLQLLPGVYEVNEPQIITSCAKKQNINQEIKHQSWHANLSKVSMKLDIFKEFISVNILF